MPDDAHDMSLPALGIDGIAHRFAIDGQTLVGFAMGGLPALERPVELVRRDADEQVANHIFTRDHAAAVDEPTAEPCACLGAQTLDPVRHGLVAPHPTQRGPGGEREHGREGMAAPLGAAGIGDGGKARGQQAHLVGSQHDRRSSITIWGFKNGPSQQGPGLGGQGIHKDHLGGVGCGAIAVLGAPKAFGVAHVEPVGRVVQRSPKPGGINKGFQQEQRMSKALLPIGRQPSLA